VREPFYRLAAEDNRRDTATPCEAIAIKTAFSCGGSINDHLIDVLMLDMEPLAGETPANLAAADTTPRTLSA
jgi:hypothetical protein